jgi:hypothetical protein
MAGSIAKRADGKWRARYRDESGKEHSRHFDRKIDAQQWLDQVTSAVVTGTYADPKAGRITFAAFFWEWSARQVWAPGTVLAMSLAARYVPFAEKSMKQVRRSDVETWIKQMNAAGLAPGTIKTRYVNVRSVFRAAAKDRVIGSDPTDGVRLPRGRRADVAMSIPAPEEVARLMSVADERFQPFIALCAFAACGWVRPPGSSSATSTSSAGRLRSPARSSASTVARSTCERRSTAQSASSTSPTASSPCSPITSPLTALPARIGGSSPGRATNHRTRTPSATGGARRCARPVFPASSSTT